jgi:hypothetical protein
MTDEKKQPSDDPRRFKSTEELAFANIGGTLGESLPFDSFGERGQHIYSGVTGAERQRRLRDIDAVMRSVIREDVHRPLGPSLPTANPAGAARAYNGPTTGWVDPGPLQVPGGITAQTAIERMVDAALPHSARPSKKSEE